MHRLGRLTPRAFAKNGHQSMRFSTLSRFPQPWRSSVPRRRGPVTQPSRRMMSDERPRKPSGPGQGIRYSMGEGDSPIQTETMTQWLIFRGSLVLVVGGILYMTYRTYTDYFSEGSIARDREEVERVPLYRGNPVVFFDVEADGEDIGRVVLQLRKDLAPLFTENFRSLCTGERGLGYRGSRIHGVVPGRAIHGGDITHGTGTGGKTIYGTPMRTEKTPLRHIGPGILSMAGPRDEFTSQFFISLARVPSMDGRFPVFGNVMYGFETLERLEKLADGTPHVVKIRGSGELRMPGDTAPSKREKKTNKKLPFRYIGNEEEEARREWKERAGKGGRSIDENEEDEESAPRSL